MIYQIDVSSVASEEADRAALQIARISGERQSRIWYEGLFVAIESLRQMPKRCGLARENAFFSQELRQLLYGKGRNTYRIVFAILEGEQVSIVRVIRIRHASQSTIGETPEEE
jgi:plasmid stabilization system protein ParE